MPATAAAYSSVIDLSPRAACNWTDDLNTTTVVDSATVLLPFTLTDGTGSEQANCYWKDVVTVPGEEAITPIDLQALPLNAMGGSGTLTLAKAKLVLLRNRSLTNTVTFNSGTFAAFPNLTAEIGPGDVLYMTNFGEVVSITATKKFIRLNPVVTATPVAVDVEIYIVGVKT